MTAATHDEGPVRDSHPPEEKVVGAVISAHRLAAVGESEVLVAVASADDQQLGFRTVSGGVPLLCITQLLVTG